MLFAATVPSYAVTDVSVSSFLNTSTNTGINAGQLMQSLLNSIVAINSKLPAVTSTGTVFENIDTRLGHIESWLVPENSAGTNPSLYQLILELGIAAQSYLPYIPTISNYVGNWMTQNNTNQDDLKKALTNYYYSYGAGQISASEIARNGHAGLLSYDSSTGKYKLTYSAPIIGYNGNQTSVVTSWAYGSPLGNVAWMLKNYMQSFVNESGYINRVGLTHYGDTLTTWESQFNSTLGQNILTQVEFTPESAIQGLYRYLAYIQKDTAKLQHVLASDDDISLRQTTLEDVHALTTNIYGNNSDNSPSTQNWFDIGDVGTGIKENMNTGASATGIFNLFTGNHTSAWFSQETANELNNTGSGSRSLKASAPQPVYETPLLDKQVNEIMSIFGGGQ